MNRGRRLFSASSAILCAVLAACYAFRPDCCAAITFLPPWFWTPIGLVIALPDVRKRPRAAFLAALALWIGYTLTFSEEPWSLLRRPAMTQAAFQQARRSARGLRVVTLNCNGGSAEAASEVKAFSPDIVLLQESPTSSQVAGLAKSMFGVKAGYVCGPDDAIVAHGQVMARKQPADLNTVCTSAVVRLDSGIELVVYSFRLAPPIVRLDLWSPDCWRSQADNRRERRMELLLIARDASRVSERIPVVMGGDFNASAGDAIFRVLRPRFRDTFAERGVGWGNTVLNEFPAERFDQVWTTRHFQTIGVRAYKTQASDHRLLVCDLAIE